MMNQFYNAFTVFLSLIVEAMPFLLLGVLLSSGLLLFMDERKLIAFVPRHPFLAALAGSFVGFLFPVCECGNVPIARRLIMQGIPTSAVIGFLLAAPTINPIVIWSTWVAFRDQPEIVIFRVLFSLIIATCIGWIFSVQKDVQPLLQPLLAKRLNLLKYPQYNPQQTPKESLEKIPALLQSGTFLLSEPGQPLRMDGSINTNQLMTKYRSPLFSGKLQLFLDNVVQELRELGGMLILGSALAACIQVFIPREIILNLGQGTISSIVAMILLAGIVSICSTVDSFFALSFASTFTSSSLLAFLVFGPMIDIKGIGLMLSIFKPRMIIYLFALAAQMTFIFTLSFSYFF